LRSFFSLLSFFPIALALPLAARRDAIGGRTRWVRVPWFAPPPARARPRIARALAKPGGGGGGNVDRAATGRLASRKRARAPARGGIRCRVLNFRGQPSPRRLPLPSFSHSRRRRSSGRRPRAAHTGRRARAPRAFAQLNTLKCKSSTALTFDGLPTRTPPRAQRSAAAGRRPAGRAPSHAPRRRSAAAADGQGVAARRRLCTARLRGSRGASLGGREN
jgi:hypothetical protein